MPASQHDLASNIMSGPQTPKGFLTTPALSARRKRRRNAAFQSTQGPFPGTRSCACRPRRGPPNATLSRRCQEAHQAQTSIPMSGRSWWLLCFKPLYEEFRALDFQANRSHRVKMASSGGIIYQAWARLLQVSSWLVCANERLTFRQGPVYALASRVCPSTRPRSSGIRPLGTGDASEEQTTGSPPAAKKKKTPRKKKKKKKKQSDLM